MNTLVIRNGKFIRNGKEEPVKIGDPDQIRVLKEQVAYIEAISDEGIIIDDLLSYREFDDDDDDDDELVLQFDCVCGCSIDKSFDMHYESNMHLFNNKKFKCGKCGKRYVITKHDDSYFYVVKLIK
jgi:hypothetical protein